jgi:hypothetical protein
MRFVPFNLAADEFAKPSEPPSIGDLFYAGKRHVLSGAPESAKTILAFIAGLETIRACGSWAHVDFEMGPSEARRLAEDLGATTDEIAAINYFEAEGPPDDDDLAELHAREVTFVTIDAAAGAYDASELDDNKRGDVERFASAWIKPLWIDGITTVVLDHVTKNSECRGRFSIGSERKLGGCDVHLGLEIVKPLSRGGSGLYKVVTHKDRPGHLSRPNAAELELRSDPETHRIAWTFRPSTGGSGNDDKAWKPDFLMDRVLEHVAHPFYEAVSRSALAGSVKGRRQFVLQAIDCLLEDGRLTLVNRKVVPVPGNVPGTFSESRGT